ncbi:MAG: glycoside hydrolase family 16 protein [Ginsengibacter sp.]
MTKLSLRLVACSMIAMVAIISCKHSIPAVEENNEPVSNGRPQQPPPPSLTHGICGYDLDEAAVTAAGWTKTFNEDFSTNLDNWNVWYGGAFNNELQLYQQSNLSIANGNLVITSKKETVTGPTTPYDQTTKSFNYTSGRIESKTTISASAAAPKVRVTARIMLPPGYGMWPAFWSYGDPWPTQGEIDILEARGQEGNKYQTNYFYGKTSGRNLVKNAEGYITTDVSLQNCYHVYELIWSQSSLQFFFDGQLVQTNTGSYVNGLFGKSEKIALNVAVGGLFFSNLDPTQIVTGSMYVDWVKVFTSN